MRMGLRLPSFLRRKEEKAAAKVEREEIKIEPRTREIPEAELKKYIGKHVAVVDGRIAASASTARMALKMAKQKHPHGEISLSYVGGGRLLISCNCLGKNRKGSSGGR
jgi:hypothetical protein